MNFFDDKDLGNHLLQLCPKVVKHSVYAKVIWSPSKLPFITDRWQPNGYTACAEGASCGLSVESFNGI